MSSCADFCCMCCRGGSSASDILAFWPAAAAAHCCRFAGKCSPPCHRRQIRPQSRTTRYRRSHSGDALCAAVPWSSSNASHPFSLGSVRHPSSMPEPKGNGRSNIHRLSERVRFLRSRSCRYNRIRFSLCCRPSPNAFLSDPRRSVTLRYSYQSQFITIRRVVPILPPQARPIQNP